MGVDGAFMKDSGIIVDELNSGCICCTLVGDFQKAVDELIELVDSFGSPAAGICWDFGHAHSVYRDQAKALRKIGHRLKATHVQDNRGNLDGHLIPFIGGNIRWEEIMPALVEIGYTGDFIFETHRFTQNLPEALRASAGNFAREMGEYCLSLAK